MKIKIIKQDGSKAEVEIDGAIDFQGMGVLSPDEVTALETRALAEGKTSAERIAQEKIDAAERKLVEYEASLTDKQRGSVKAEERIAAMEKTLQSMRADMESAQKASQEATIAKALADARSGLAFTDGGQTIFDMQMRSKMQPDGTFILATGERGTIDQARQEWASSPVGKALIKAQATGGAGTGPTSINGTTFADIVKDPALKEQYIAQHGEAKYAADYLSHRKSQQK
jgi:hypothetical protein